MLQERKSLPTCPATLALTVCHRLLSTCACVEYFGRALETLIKKVSVCCIHGKMKDKRNKIFADFRSLKRWGISFLFFFFLQNWNRWNVYVVCLPVESWCAQMWWPEASTYLKLTGCCSTTLPAVPGECPKSLFLWLHTARNTFKCTQLLSLSLSQCLRSSMWAYGSHRQSG